VYLTIPGNKFAQISKPEKLVNATHESISCGGNGKIALRKLALTLQKNLESGNFFSKPKTLISVRQPHKA
jgi:hypothetical protein